MLDEDILAELKEIRFHLSLLTHEVRSKAFKRFESDILKTDARIRMFYAFDDSRNAQQIADVGGVTRQAALNLLRDLEQGSFLSVRTVGQAQVGKPNIDAILDWYHSLPAS